MEKNLENKEAVQKFLKLVNDINTCMFITNSTEDKDHTRPMATVSTDEDGTLWFYTDIRSIKVEEIAMKKQVHLIYAHPGKSSYLDVWGTASVVTDKSLLKEKWSPIMKAWFPNGPEDPNIALLKVSPHDVYYWDAEKGKMVSFLKIAARALTGAQVSEGVEGKINF